MTITQWCKFVHKVSKEKGWWDIKKSPLEIHALIHSEISEATEEVRKDCVHLYVMDNKPEGELIELADAVIRIMDWCEFNGWDLEYAMKIKSKYNATRSYRHGNKKY